MRTDAHNNPTAFTTDIAKQAGLVLGNDYKQGAPFISGGKTFYTAKLLDDPVAITIRVINAVSFYTHAGFQRWTYIGLPKFIWQALSSDQQRDVIGYMYFREGGQIMRGLFPNYGKA